MLKQQINNYTGNTPLVEPSATGSTTKKVEGKNYYFSNKNYSSNEITGEQDDTDEEIVKEVEKSNYKSILR